MMEKWPQFILMVDSEREPGEFLARLKEIWPDAESSGGRTLILLDQVVEVLINDEFDAARVNDPGSGHRFYKYEVQVSPLDMDASVAHQIEVARQLKSELQEAGFRVVVVADFERELREENDGHTIFEQAPP